VQHIVFGLPDAARHEKIQENVLPVTVLASFVLAGVGLPLLPKWAGPLAVAQARKPPSGDIVTETSTQQQQPQQVAKVTRSQTVTGSTTTRTRRARPGNDEANEAHPKKTSPKTTVKSPRVGTLRSTSSEAIGTSKASLR
jgi:phosphatidylinositol 4-kinase B